MRPSARVGSKPLTGAWRCNDGCLPPESHACCSDLAASHSGPFLMTPGVPRAEKLGQGTAEQLEDGLPRRRGNRTHFPLLGQALWGAGAHGDAEPGGSQDSELWAPAGLGEGSQLVTPCWGARSPRWAAEALAVLGKEQGCRLWQSLRAGRWGLAPTPSLPWVQRAGDQHGLHHNRLCGWKIQARL